MERATTWSQGESHNLLTPEAVRDTPRLDPLSVPQNVPDLPPIASALSPPTVSASTAMAARPSMEPTVRVLPAPDVPIPLAALAGHERLERVVNVLLAGGGLLLAAPLLLTIAVAVKVTSRGPVLYRQPRVGLDRRGVRAHARRRIDHRWHLWAQFLAQHDDQRSSDLGGSVFMIYKFRTMREDAERGTGAVWAVKNDPRSTVIGAFLRRYRLDELPQLVNVLQGDMNVVGPRPERPSIFARLSEEIAEYRRRQRSKPGITGWAQIHLLYDSCVDDVRKKVRYDLEYLRQKSITRDLTIIAKTLPSVLFKRRGW